MNIICKETIECGPRRLLTKGGRYEVIERKRHPAASHAHYVVLGDDGKKHVFPETLFTPNP